MCNLLTEARRIYITGNTYAVRDQIRAIGGHWDAERNQWWVGTGKRAEAEALIASLSAPAVSSAGGTPPAEEKEDLSACPVIAKCEYTSKAGKVGTYYVIAEARDGSRVRLTTLQGTMAFWADRSAVRIVKQYEPREVWDGRRYSGRTERKYQTLGGLQQFVAGQRDPRTARGECYECGHWGPVGTRCEECHEGTH